MTKRICSGETRPRLEKNPCRPGNGGKCNVGSVGDEQASKIGER